MRSFKLQGALLGLVAFGAFSAESSAYIIDPDNVLVTAQKTPRKYQGATLAEVRANPTLFRDVWIKIPVRFDEMTESPDVPAWTVFAKDDYACFGAWDLEQELWKDEEHANAHRYFFVKKDPDEMTYRSADLDFVRWSKRYDEILVSGFVQNDLNGQPWILVDKVEPFNRPCALTRFLAWIGAINPPRPLTREFIEAMHSGDQFSSSHPDLAIGEYRRAYDHSPAYSKYDRAAAARALGIALSQAGLEKAPEAIPYLREASCVFPRDADVNEWLAKSLIRAGRPHQAAEALERAVALDSRHAGYRILLAEALRETGRDAEAQNSIMIAVEQEDRKDDKKEARNPEPYLALGRLYRSEGRLDDAEKVFQKALEAAATKPGPYIELGELYYDMKKYDKARDQLINGTDFAKDNQDVGRVNYLQGLLDKVDNKSAEAKQHFKEAVNRAPNLAEPHYELGLILASENQLEQAIGHFEEARAMGRDGLRHLAALEAARALYAKDGNDDSWLKAGKYLKELLSDPKVAPAIQDQARELSVKIMPAAPPALPPALEPPAPAPAP